MRRWIVGLVAVAAAGCELSSEQCSIDQVCAAAGERFGVGGGLGSVLLRDLDGDGAPEWIAVSPALGTLAVTWGYSGEAQTWPVGQSPTGLAIADVDGDGRLDVAVPLAGDGSLALLRGAGLGALGSVERVGAGPRPLAVAAADLDGDGRAEVIVADEQDGALRVLRYGPDGLGAGAPVAAGEGPTALAAGDFSGDGRVDVAVTLEREGVAKLFLGTGNGGLRAGEVLYAGAGPQRALAADVDGDGALDLAVIDDLLDEAAVVLGDGAGGARETRRWSVPAGPTDMAFRAGPEGHELIVMSWLQKALTRVPLAGPERRTSQVASTWQGLAVGDVDGDGAEDVVIGDPNWGAVRLRDAPGYGFAPWFEAEDIGLSGPLAARDLDRDGWLDLVVSDGERHEIAVLRGQEGGFAAAVRSPGPKQAAALMLTDLDGDGVDDVVTWQRGGYVTPVEVRGGSLWSARGVGERFASPAEFAFAGDPRRIVAFDGDGDGRSELLALQGPVAPYSGIEAAEDAGPGLLTLALADDGFALIDRAMSSEFVASDDVLVGDFSPAHVGDELIRLAPGVDQQDIVIESRSAGERWIGGSLPRGRTMALTRGDLDGDGIADLVICGEDGLMMAAGREWNAFDPGVPIADTRCDGAIVAELDGDGRADVVATVESLGEPVAEVLLGHALSWLPELVTGGMTTASNRPHALALADFDGDGLPDLAASGADGLQVLRGGPQLVLEPDWTLAMRAGVAGGLVLADVDGDGRDDVVAFGRGGDVGLGMFDGTGTLGPVRYTMSQRALQLQDQSFAETRMLLDVDGDGADELLWAIVVPNEGVFLTELQRVRGDRFERAVELPFDIFTYALPRAGDLDGDGDDDLVYVHMMGALVSHAGGPEGLAPAQVGPLVADTPRWIELADVDRDGRLDVLVSISGDALLVFPGDGRGGFAGEPHKWPMGRTGEATVAGDLDDDGFGDLLAPAGHGGSANLRVCYGGANGGPRGDCRDFELGPVAADIDAFAVDDVDADGVTDVLAVLSQGPARSLVFARGGDGRLGLHVKPLPDGAPDSIFDPRGELRKATLDDAGPEWVYVDRQEVTRLGVRVAR